MFGRSVRAAIATVLVVLASSAHAGDGPIYDIFIQARVVPSERLMRVEIETSRGARHLKELSFRIDPERHLGFSGDGRVEADGDRVIWTPPTTGGALRYTFRIDHLRNERSYDSRCANTWAIFRGGDMVPPARARFSDGARSRTRLQFVLPEGWSAAAPYTRLRGGIYKVENDSRSFDRPTGWFALGDLGVTREEIGGTRVAVAGPVRHGIRRFDMLALLQWTLPELNRIIGTPLERLLIVSAGDPMWRGGLSGPRSLYLHAGRPLVSNDGTSPILHELVHTAMSARADDVSDWLVEGLAEYYSMQLLKRSGTVAAERIDAQLMAAEAGNGGVRGSRHGGSQTWLGVGYMVQLDANIREQSRGQHSLDDVLRVLAANDRALDFDLLREAVSQGTSLDPADVLPPDPSPRSSPSREDAIPGEAATRAGAEPGASGAGPEG